MSFVGSHHYTSSEVPGRVIIDCKEFWNLHRSMNKPSQGKKVLSLQDENHLKLPAEEILLLPNSIPRFSLSLKVWKMFVVVQLKPVEYIKDAFINLILPQETKTMLSSLVQLHKDQALQFDDLILGKGKGVIILLHGVPGVGKTLTAGEVSKNSRGRWLTRPRKHC